MEATREMTKELAAALRAVEAQGERDYEGCRRSAFELAELGFSRRQIAELTGLIPHQYPGAQLKEDRTGGSLSADSLEAIVRATKLSGYGLWDAVYEAYKLGTSAKMIALLLGISKSTVWYHIRRLRDLDV